MNKWHLLPVFGSLRFIFCHTAGKTKYLGINTLI